MTGAFYKAWMILKSPRMVLDGMENKDKPQEESKECPKCGEMKMTKMGCIKMGCN